MKDNKDKLTTEEVRLTQEEVQEKVDELKKDILDKKIDTVKLVNSMNTTLAKLEEYKVKKAKTRKRNKIQKASRKKNR